VGQEFQLLLVGCRDADRNKPQEEQLVATLKPTAADKTDYKPGIHEDIWLRLRVNNAQAGAAGGGEPLVSFAYSLNGRKFTDCGTPFAMRQGKWIGAKFGYVAYDTNPKTDKGWIDADWIHVER